MGEIFVANFADRRAWKLALVWLAAGVFFLLESRENRAAEVLPPAKPQPVTIRSQSGQFIVRGMPQGWPTPTTSTSVVQYLRLDPNLTAVSLERIRQAIQTELGLPNRWQGMISVVTEPVRAENTRVTITSLRYPSGWGYRITFPEIIDKDRFVSAVAKTVLMEYANQRAVSREAELPLWLSEGLTAELMARALPVLALEAASEINGRGQSPDPLAAARQRLREREPISFDDLSMPTGDLGEADAAHYRACAHVFVHELMRLRDGRACLRRMLEGLPDNFNWQTTFLQAFERHFKRLLDVDQWYALAVTGTQTRELSSILSPVVTLDQLDGITTTEVEVRVAAQELPIRIGMKLSRLVTEWDYPRQHGVLVGKIGRLRALQPRAAPETAGLVDAYLEALTTYVGPKNLNLPTKPKAVARLRPKGDLRTLLEKLDQLEARRVELVDTP